MSVEELEDALQIPQPASDKLVLEDCRRLTGPGLLWEHAGAIADVRVVGFNLDAVEACWIKSIKHVFAAVGWESERWVVRQFENGLNLAISAPIDQLYSAIFVVQTAWYITASELLREPAREVANLLQSVRDVMQREARPELLVLQDAARQHGVDFVADDEAVSLGHGCGSQVWDIEALPEPAGVDWDRLHDLPVAMITGTNGKSTCVRLSAAVARASGCVAGFTSTDYVCVGDDILDRGDYSGPGGARMLLRDPRLEIALLEVARGGILRRGLALKRAQAGLVTNVAADHLGQYGVNTVPELTEAKFAVFRTLAPGATLVLNADDVGLVDYARAQSVEVRERGVGLCWFSLDSERAEVANARASGTPCAWLDREQLRYFDGGVTHDVCSVRDVPITMDGAARYNVQNSLAVICLSQALGLSLDDARAGLANFQSNPDDNPGRCNEFDVRGARVFVDFAHNPHSIAAVADTMKNLPARRRLLMLGHAGDRSDEDIRGLTAGAFTLNPDRVVICEVPEYLRGRDVGEVSAVIRAECLQQGLPQDSFSLADDPLSGAGQALDWLEPGDLALLLVYSQRDEIVDLLEG